LDAKEINRIVQENTDLNSKIIELRIEIEMWKQAYDRITRELRACCGLRIIPFTPKKQEKDR